MVERMMIATKPFRYRNRMISAGDIFSAKKRDGDVFEAIKRAKHYTGELPEVASPPPKEVAEKAATVAHEADLDKLRKRAEDLGIPVDLRWREQRLNEEIQSAETVSKKTIPGTVPTPGTAPEPGTKPVGSVSSQDLKK